METTDHTPSDGQEAAGPWRTAQPRITVLSAVATFVVVDLVTMVVIALAVAWLFNRNATANAVRDARDLTVAEGRAVVWPLVTDALVAGDDVARSRLDQVVRQRVLSDRLVRVKVWSEQGSVLYSDEPRLVGRQFSLGADELAALRTERPAANVSDLSEPENQYERQFHKLLQVYVGLKAPGGRAVLFESYIRFSTVTADGHRTLVSLLPVMFAALVLLFVVQVPLAWTMARRLELGRLQERRLLLRALHSAEVERRHIAADLHDGPVQTLAGTAMSLTAAAGQAEDSGLSTVATSVRGAAAELRQGIRDLRTMIVAIAPPRLHDEGLAAALDDLVSPLRARGVMTELDVARDLGLGRRSETLVYRAAQEAVRNITRHAPTARHVVVRVARSGLEAQLQVTDDGPGIETQPRSDRGAHGHMGLHLLSELAAEEHGHLEVHRTGATGTTLTLTLPA